MQKKLFIILLCLFMILSNITYAEEVKSYLTSTDLGTPLYLNLEVIGNQFLIGWRNPDSIYGFHNVEYQIDFKYGREEWISESKELPTNYLFIAEDGKSTIAFNPVMEGLITEDVDLEKNSYSFRLRYKYYYLDDGVISFIEGNFSSPVTLGLQPYYQNSNDWAIDELDRAVEYDLIPDSIRYDMKANISREEFSEIVVKMYELQTGETINYDGQAFNDTLNSEVLKAAKLGIVKGVGGGNFDPSSPITRQEIAVILTRTLAILYPDMNFRYGTTLEPTTESNIAEWAIHEVNFLREQEILKGDGNGNIYPTSHTTREQAVILTLRTHDKFK